MLASVGGVLLLVAAGTHPTGAFTSSSLSTSRRRHTGTTVRMGMGNSWGRLFRISTWGESHGGGVGVVVDGVPPRLPISTAEIQKELTRRRPGQSRLTTPRQEDDQVEILSGVVNGVALGTPIALLVRNKDQRSNDYDEMALKYRPSHADATYDAKYGVRAVAGGGRSSARETIGRVAAGAIAKKILRTYSGVEVLCYVKKIQEIEAEVDHDAVTAEQIEDNIVRCPDPEVAEQMIARVDEIRKKGNSVGGVVECVVRNVPAGLGSPVFDKLEGELAKACMSLPASKGFEVGSGFGGTMLTGIEHNDPFYVDEEGRTRTRSNRSGGIQGGISNGENIVLRVAFKPTSTISSEQDTVTRGGVETKLRGKGRHDPCVLPRACPMVDAMVALVLCDMLLQQHAQCDVLLPMLPLEGFDDEGERSNPLGGNYAPVIPEPPALDGGGDRDVVPAGEGTPKAKPKAKMGQDVYAEEN
jgi:chorismate synthase